MRSPRSPTSAGVQAPSVMAPHASTGPAADEIAALLEPIVRRAHSRRRRRRASSTGAAPTAGSPPKRFCSSSRPKTQTAANHFEAVGFSPTAASQPVSGLRPASPGAGDEPTARNTDPGSDGVLAGPGRRRLGTPYYVMEQVPTVGSPGEFPPYHAAGLYFERHRSSAQPCGGAACRPSPMSTPWTGAGCGWTSC